MSSSSSSKLDGDVMSGSSIGDPVGVSLSSVWDNFREIDTVTNKSLSTFALVNFQM